MPLVESQRQMVLIAIKVCAALAALIFCVVGVNRYLVVDMGAGGVIDQGPRGLIVVSSEGSVRNYKLNFRTFVDEQGEYRIVIFFSSRGTTFGNVESTRTRLIDFDVTFAGVPDGEVVRCGEDLAPAASTTFSQVPAGTRAALRIDAEGGLSSALNFDGPDAFSLRDREFQMFSGATWLLDDQRYAERVEDDGTVWSESCVLPKAMVWRDASEKSWFSSGRRSLLVPQVNWTSRTARTDFQTKVAADVTVQRKAGDSLIEAYPQFETNDSGYTYDLQSYWIGSRGERRNIAYTDQPVLIMAQRDGFVNQSLFLLWAGAALGLIGTLTISAISRSADLMAAGVIWAHRRLRRPKPKAREPHELRSRQHRVLTIRNSPRATRRPVRRRRGR